MVTLHPIYFYRRDYLVSCRSAREQHWFVEIRNNPANFNEFPETWDQFRELPPALKNHMPEPQEQTKGN
jgi:hypothetical protein